MNLLNLFVSCNNYFVQSLGFSTYMIMLSANRDNFTSSFPVWVPFNYFSCPIALAWISSTMLKRSGESMQPCLVPDLRGQAFSFFPINYNVVYGLFIYGLYCVEVRSFYTYFVERFNDELVLNFVKCFF